MSSGILNRFAQPKKVVDLTYSVWENYLGNYYMGQTGTLTFDNEYNAWAALINPPDSGVDMFWNVYTLSNFSSQPFTAEAWLNSAPPGKGTFSENVASSNQAMHPPTKPKIQIQYGEKVQSPPLGGIYLFTRVVEPGYTLTRHDFQGMIIIPPGGSVIAYLKPSGKGPINSIVAMGWWEQECAKSRRLPEILREENKKAEF